MILLLAAVVLFGAIYIYTGRLAEGLDRRADHTDALINGLAVQAAQASSDMLAATERQTKAFRELEKGMATREHYVFETGRELSAAGRDLRAAMQLVERDLAERASQ